MNTFPTKNTDAAYWKFQALFWAVYTVFSLSFAVHYAGWTPAIIVGYMLYPFYSIGLTHLLHREFRRWRGLSLPTWKRIVELVLAIVAIGLVQTFLIGVMDLLFEGRDSLFHNFESMMYTAWGTTSAVAMWVFVYYLRHHREQRTQLQLALREAELSALEAQINPHFLFNCLNSIRALVAENPGARPGHDHSPGQYFPLQSASRSPRTPFRWHAEVEVVSDYLALESVRFEDRLRVRAGDLGRRRGKRRFHPCSADTGGERSEARHRSAVPPAAICRFAPNGIMAPRGSKSKTPASSARNADGGRSRQASGWPTRASACASCMAAAPACNCGIATTGEWSPRS